MSNLRCTATCYMPSEKEGVEVERYEDEPGEDVYDVPAHRVDEFMASGNFEVLSEGEALGEALGEPDEVVGP